MDGAVEISYAKGYGVTPSGDAAFGHRKRKTAYGYVWEVAQ